MKRLRLFMAIPVMALCASLTLSGCNDENENGGGGVPSIGFDESSSSESGFVVPVMILNADQVSYAVLQRSTASEAQVPVPSDFKTLKVSEMKSSDLVIPKAEIAGFGTYDVYAYATKSKTQSLHIHTTVEYTEANYAPKLSFEVLNMTPYSLDVKVNVSSIYNKYVTTVFREDVYNEVNFTASAEMSINPDASQQEIGVQPYLVNTGSKTIPEAQLLKDTKYNSIECKGLILQRFADKNVLLKHKVAIYAIDKFGNTSVYTSKEAFELPDAVISETPTVNIAPKATFTTLSAEFTAVGDCAKVVYGALTQDETAQPDEFWAEANKPAAVAFLAALQIKDAPCIYTGQPISRTMSAAAQPGRKMVVYTMGITRDGKVGPVNYKLVPMQMPVLDGTATIPKIEADGASKNTLKWKITPAPGAKKYRFLVTGSMAFNSTFTDELILNWTMSTNESPNGYGWWDEVSAADLAKTDNVFEKQLSVAGQTYVIRGIAQDANDKWGKITAGPNQDTELEEVVDTKIDFSKGTGAVLLNVTKQDPKVEGGYTSYDVTFKITKGVNTASIYCVAFREIWDYKSYDDFTYANVLASCTEDFNTTTVDGVFPPLADSELGTEQIATNLSAPSSYGTCFWVFITKDNSDNYKIAAVLLPGRDPLTF